MDMLIKAVAVSLAGCAAALAVKKANPEISFALTLIVAVAVLFSAVRAVGETVGFIRETAGTAGISEEALACVFKALAASAVTRIVSDVCKDAGGRAAASAVEIAGTAVGLCAVIPLMRAVITIVKGLL